MVTNIKERVPVRRLPTDLENGTLSKAQSLEKWRKQKELDAKMRAYEAKARAEIEAEAAVDNSPEVQVDVQVEEPKEEETVKAEPVKRKKK
jgi:hypothetical protein